MTLHDFNPKQLRRIYDGLYTRRLGTSTWDWSTLCGCYPSVAFTFRQIARIMRDKEQTA